MYEWRNVLAVNFDDLKEVKGQLHQAIQNVAAVGRKFSPKSRDDAHATLVWVPGLSRLAGKWVDGNITFRSSISLDEFKIYLVDEKVIPISTFYLNDKTQRQGMVWLEEQIGKLGLVAADLTMNLPYEIPPYSTQQGDPFFIKEIHLLQELGKYYHNAFIAMRSFREQHNLNSDIVVWPHHLDEAMDVIINDSGDPDTTSKITLGMSPGDDDWETPYFYVSSWPHAPIERAEKLGNGALWVSDHWTGAILPAKILVNQKDQEHQVVDFYKEAASQLTQLLTN